MEPNNNSEEGKPKEEAAPDASSAQPAAPATPPAPFPEPTVLVATVDPKQEPEKPKTGFSFSNPSVTHQANKQATKGDAQQQQQQASQAPPQTNEERLKKLDEAIKRDEGSDKVYTYDDYRDTGEMFIEMWEGGLQLIGQLISKDSSPSAYSFLEEKKKKLIEQATKVSRKRNWVVPIEASFLGNLIPASARIVIKANDGRKVFMENKRKAEAENRDQDIVKGGPNKGEVKTRGPGRPRK